MTWTDTFNRIADHYAAMAMTPGCWAAAQHQVISMEQSTEHPGCWTGLRAAVGRRIKAAGFKPHPSELAALDRAPLPLQPARRWHGRWQHES